MSEKRICIIGHFGNDKNLLNGQTIKTKVVYEELCEQFGKEHIKIFDTSGGLKWVIKMPLICLWSLLNYNNIIILPAENGLRIYVPLLSKLNLIFHKSIHYVVIGGWLPSFIKNRTLLKKCLSRLDGIYIETDAMKKELEDCYKFENLHIVPNCKNLDIIKEENLKYNTYEPYKLCVFSRVMKEKGIEDAINVVKYINKEKKRIVITLDIYGQIDNKQICWFEELQNNFPSFITYKGCVGFNETTDVLKDYFALLFPTYYDGEGFPGTLIDAMAAGVPVIASDWKYNGEIVKEWQNGRTYKAKDNEALIGKIIEALNDVDRWNSLKKKALAEASKYKPSVALIPLINAIK